MPLLQRILPAVPALLMPLMGQAPPSPAFALHDGDVIAIAGGSGMVKQVEAGYLETILAAAAGDQRIRFRDTAWQADTVYLRQRPPNFGSQLEFLQRLEASMVVASFGQMEALDGTTELANFIEAYEQVLAEIEGRTPRVVLISPHPFEKKANPHLPDLTVHNGDVAAYSEAIRQLAARRGHVFVDLSRFSPAGRTTDGIHLTEDGEKAWAEEVSSQLLGRKVSFHPARMDPLREAIAKKNLLWRQYWRPTNWAFLYGNRQHVPSSKDHRPGMPRWFPEEINSIVPMIHAAEEKIFELQQAAK